VFALERLAAAGESDRFRRTHAEWVASLVDHTIPEWIVDGGVDRITVFAELDNWRDAVAYATAAVDAELGLQLGVHYLSGAVPETARWTETILGIDGIDRVQGWYWLLFPLVIKHTTDMDFGALDLTVRRFEDACLDARDRSWIAPFKAACEFARGGDPVKIIDRALEIPGLAPVGIADLHLYRSFYLNILLSLGDPGEARLAVRLQAEVHAITLPVAYGFLAAALRDDPNSALEALRRGEELVEDQRDPFITASVASFGSVALLSLPTPAAAAHVRSRLDHVQPHLNNLGASLLAICLVLARRVNDPVVPVLNAYLVSTPGCALVARIIDPDLSDLPQASPRPQTSMRFDEIVALTRNALDRIAQPY
jgi:hypothetical protein